MPAYQITHENEISHVKDIEINVMESWLHSVISPDISLLDNDQKDDISRKYHDVLLYLIKEINKDV